MPKPIGNALALRELATPTSSPPAGTRWFYLKSDGKLYMKDSTGVETSVGSGVAKTGDTMTGTLVVPQVEITPATGTAKGRFGGLSGVEAWTGMFLNCQYVAGSGWDLDDDTKPGWFFKLDSRAGLSEFAVYRIPAGAGYHTDEAFLFRVDSAGLVSVMNRITGVSNATGATDALPKGQADLLYAAIGHTHAGGGITQQITQVTTRTPSTTANATVELGRIDALPGPVQFEVTIVASGASVSVVKKYSFRTHDGFVAGYTPVRPLSEVAQSASFNLEMTCTGGVYNFRIRHVSGSTAYTLTAIFEVTGYTTPSWTDLSGTSTSTANLFFNETSSFQSGIPMTSLPAPNSGGDATSSQLVIGSDSRLTDARTPVAHNHVKANITDFAHTHVATTDLTATGSKNSSTFLRGDNTWAAPTIPSSQITDFSTAGSSAGDVLRHNGSAYVHFRTPACSVRTAASTQSIANNTWTFVNLDETLADYNYGSWTIVNNGFLVPVDGVYAFSANANWDNTSGTGRRLFTIEAAANSGIAVNAGTILVRSELPGTNAVYGTTSLSAQAFLTAGMHVRLICLQTSGAALLLRHDLILGRLSGNLVS